MSPLGKNLLSLVFGLAITATSGKAVAAEPPNIIVVNVDDIGPAWLPPYARKLTPADIEQKTANEYGIMHKDEGTLDLAKHLEAARHSMPFVDSLAQNGMVFDRCFATSSLCAPSRSALLTGCYQQRWGAFSIPDVFAIGIPKDVPVLAENFQAAGYDCGIVGKWHVAEHDPALAGGDKKTNGYSTSSEPGQGPLDRGFNYYFGYNNSGSHYYEADDLWDGKQRVPKRPVGEFLTDFLSSKCVDFVSQAVAKKQRFLLYFAPMSLHGALRPPPEKYSSQFHTGMKFSDQYAGHLLALDEGIRKIFDVLKASGQDQNTLFMLSADNGQSKYRVPPYNAPYRGGKGTGWLGGTHEPLIISWPAQLHAGWHHELVSTMDIFATALDAAGLAPTKPIDGRSLLPLMRGQTKTGPHDELFSAGLHSTYFSDSYFPGDTEEIDRGHADVSDEKKCPLYAWRQDSDTVLTYITKIQPGLYPEFPQGRPEQRLYYNLKTDPQEDSNLFSDTPQVEKASGDLGDWLRTTKAPIIEHAEDYKQLFQMAPPSSNKVP
jgi:uncharacterized sulfatase